MLTRSVTQFEYLLYREPLILETNMHISTVMFVCTSIDYHTSFDACIHSKASPEIPVILNTYDPKFPIAIFGYRSTSIHHRTDVMWSGGDQWEPRRLSAILHPSIE